mmetsp:Transcript_50190/g.145545  ORF Transcript_50190/g.145545 Transcript_50190/m.145545 type:complete len:102 (+) Transcript_50190:325-630(+)
MMSKTMSMGQRPSSGSAKESVEEELDRERAFGSGGPPVRQRLAVLHVSRAARSSAARRKWAPAAGAGADVMTVKAAGIVLGDDVLVVVEAVVVAGAWGEEN